LGTSVKISQEKQNFVKVGQKYQALYYLIAKVHFIVDGAGVK